MNTVEQCDHIKNIPKDLIFQCISWEVNGILYSVCEECYRALLNEENRKEQYK